MIWTSESINELSKKLEYGSSLKSLLREMSINFILTEVESELKFPFYIPYYGYPYFSGMSDIGVANNIQNYKSSNILFKMTDIEEKKYKLYEEEPIELFKLLNNKSKIRPHEEKIISSYKNNKFSFIKSPSNRGFTNLLSFCAIHYLIYNRNKSVGIFTQGFSRKIYKLYESLPFYLKPGIVEMNLCGSYDEIIFDNSNIVFSSQSSCYPPNKILPVENADKKFDFLGIDLNSYLIPSLFNNNKFINESKVIISSSSNLDMKSDYIIFDKIEF